MTLATANSTVTLRDLTVKFDAAVQAATPFYPQICNVVPSNGADEKYGFLGSMPGVREWLGERKFKELRAADFTIENKGWEVSIDIDRHRIDDDRLGFYVPVMQQLGIEAAYHPDELVFETLLINAESTACWDGQFFVDTDHSWGDSGSQSNDLTYNAADHTTVTGAEFKAAFHAARKAMMKFKNDSGKLLNRPVVASLGNLMCIVPPELEVAAYEGLYSLLLGGGNTNIVRDLPKIVVCPHLTSAVKWWLFNLSGGWRPFVFQARSPLQRMMKGADDIEHKSVKFMTEARYNAGYFAWWTCVQTEFN